MKVLTAFNQGSDAWLAQRCGKVTMSRAKDLLTGGKGKTRQSYILDLVAERLSGKSLDNYWSVDMQRGSFLEEYAVAAFEYAYPYNDVSRVGFVLADDERIGCSPDGLIGVSGGLEIKCPGPRQHIRNFLAGGTDDYLAQVHGNMWVCKREWWFIVSFCPWIESFPLFVRKVYRDEGAIKNIAESAIDAADQVENMLSAPIIQYGKRVAEIAQDARHAWESMQADNAEVML